MRSLKVFTAWSDGRFEIADRITRCALGRSGVLPAKDKREGDGASPEGIWPIRYGLYRPDRGPPPQSLLPFRAIAPDDGWCDAPGDSAYNRLVKHPYGASAEKMWREDGLYDVVGVLGHNDDPAVPGLGSAIFLHLAEPDYAPTEGCIALNREDIDALFAHAEAGAAIAIRQC